MRVTTRGVNLYGFIAIALMLVMIAMVFFQWVPREWHFRLFAVALTLFMIRIALRMVLARQQRLENEAKEKDKETEKNQGNTGGEPGNGRR
jgi:uncharacterized membrane protein YfcA